MNLSASSAKPGDPTYFLEGIIHDKSEMADFEGPLSLILLLLSKNKIEIRDIKISDILDQYLEYLNAMEKLDLEIASEFVQMASYLLYIKTRMLLTEEKEVTELEQLIASLEQLKCKDTYAAVKTVTPMLEAAAQTGLHYLSRPPEPLPKAAGEYRYRIEEADLLIEALENFTKADDLEPYMERAHQIEHRGDAVNHAILENVATDFITPVDREDIIEMCQALDDIVDDLSLIHI